MNNTRKHTTIKFLIGSLFLLGCYSCPTAVSKKLPKTNENAVVSLCDINGDQTLNTDQALFKAEYWQPSGGKTLLAVGAKKVNAKDQKTICQTSKLPFPATSILWATLLPQSLVPQLSRGVILEGEKDGKGQFQIENASALEAEQPTEHEKLATYLPLGENLLEYLTASPFGQEERASIQQLEGSIRIDCKEGQLPAGIIFSQAGSLLPKRKQLGVDLSFSGQGSFQFTVADENYKQKNDSLHLAAITANDTEQNLHIEINNKINPKKWQSFSMVCPKNGGMLNLQSITLQAQHHDAISHTPLTRSAWIWEPEAWQETPEQVLKALNTWNIKRAYITVPLEAERQVPVRQEALKAFIRLASKQQIAVWAVDGDRFALLPGEQTAFYNRAKAYAHYNQEVPKEEAISGIQYDIEPYLMSGYALGASAWNRRYQEFLSTVKQSTGLPIEIALPFWFYAQKIDSRLFLDEVASSIDSIAIMDYRSNPSQIVQFAKPYLKWGERYQKKVTVALETVFLPDNISQIYRPSTTGTLLLWQVQDKTMLFLLKEPLKHFTLKRDSGSVFAYSHSISSSSGNVTFHDNLSTLKELLPKLENRLQQWSSFSGMAIHGIEYRK